MTAAQMDQKAIQKYIEVFGRRFLKPDLLEKFPETRILPSYIRKHFADSEIVLDLGYGTALWFWSSFLPSLKRLDGIDLYREFLAESDRILTLHEVPEGYRISHQALGEEYTIDDLRHLQKVRGNVVVGDFTQKWPPEIANSQYDLVTEYGSLGEIATNQQFVYVVKRSTDVLKPGGKIFFVNFLEKEVLDAAKAIGRYTPHSLTLNRTLYEQAVQQAGLRIVDFHAIDNPDGMPPIKTFFYGFAEKTK